MKKKILVTGSEGFIGSRLVNFLVKKKYKVFGSYYKKNNKKNYNANYIKCDIRNLQQVKNLIEKCKPHYIFHLAAKSHPTYSFKNPIETMKTNLIGTMNMYEVVKNYKDIKVIIACSSAQFGAKKKNELPIFEKSELKPEHIYGFSKLSQDLVSQQYERMYKLKICRAIIFNTSGKGKNFDVFQDICKQFLKQKNKKIINIKVGNINNLRDFSHIDDVIDGLLVIMKKGKPGESYIISSNRLTKIKQIIVELKKLVKKKILFKSNKSLYRTFDEKYIIGNNHKLKKLGWKPMKDIRDIIKDII